MTPGITFSELAQYNREETARWRQWLEQNPTALEVTVGLPGTETATVRGMLTHIFFCDLYFAELLLGKARPFEEYERIPHHSFQDVFALGTSAEEALAEVLAKTSLERLNEVINLGWPPEKPLMGTGRKMLAHTLLHGVRHWAQIATALRQQGFATGVEHDFLFTAALG